MPRARRLPTPRDRHGRFVNWSRDLTSQPVDWRLPATEDEVVAAVREARRNGRRVKVVGAGHSWSPVAVPDDIAMSLDRLDTGICVDPHTSTVTCSGGTRLHDLSTVLAIQGYALPIVGSIQTQSVGGAIATGTHGSSLVHGNLAGLVASLRVVTGTGDILDVATGDPRLDGVRVHLGAVGIVTGATLRIHRARRLHQRIEQLPVADVPDRLADIAASAECVKVWWLPHAPTAQVVRYDATDDPATRRPSARTQRWVDEQVMHRAVFPAVVAALRNRPQVVAGWNTRMSLRYLGRSSQVGADVLMLNTPMPLRHRETEAALPLSNAPAAVHELLGIFRAGRPAATFPLEIRFVRGDAAWLSPAYGADTCQVGAYSTDNVDCSPYFESFWKVMRLAGARPHWGKELDHDAAELRALYPRYDDFRRLRHELDPDRVFANAFLDKVLAD